MSRSTKYTIDDTEGYAFTVYDESHEMVLEAAYRDSDFELFDLRIEIAADYTDDGHGSYSYIYLSSCYEERTCGLCGVWDGDTDNDFTYVTDASYNTDSYDTDDVSDISQMSSEAWRRTHNFADEWLDSEIASAAGQDSNVCPSDSISPPDEDCIDAALDLCEEIWDDYCQACDGTDYAESYESWQGNCAFDACAASGDSLDDDTEVTTAYNQGYFDGAIQVEFFHVFFA